MAKRTALSTKPLTSKELEDPSTFALSAVYLHEKPKNLADVSLPNEVSSRLTHILSHVPGFATNVMMAKGQLYKVTFSPEIMKGLHDGSLHLVESLAGAVRATASNMNGKFAGNGSLHAAKGLRTAAIGVAVWQIASVAVGQKHLSDISNKLDRLFSKVNGIAGWLEDERYGKLLGSLEYLREISEHVYDGDLTEQDLIVYRNRIEAIELQSAQIAHAVQLGMARTIKELDSIKRSFFDSGSVEIVEKIAQYRRLSNEWLFAMHVRAAAAQIFCALPCGTRQAHARIRKIHDALDINKRVQEAAQKLFDAAQVKGHISNLKVSLFGQKGKHLYAKPVSEALTGLAEHLDREILQSNEIANVLQFLKTTVRDETLGQSPFELAVEVDKFGKVASVSRIE